MLNIQSTEAVAAFLNRGISMDNLKLGKRKPKVLVIDDDHDMALLLGKGLKEKFECKIDIAEDPFEAMNKLTENFYDLIVLDWRLPVLNGGQTLRQLEKELFFEPGLSIRWDNSKVPVIVLSSAEKNQCTLLKTKHFNCVGYISKRQAYKEILSSIEPFVEVIRQGKKVTVA